MIKGSPSEAELNTGSLRGAKPLSTPNLPLSFEGEGDKGGEVEQDEGKEVK